MATPHPRDLLITHPIEIIVEAKAVGSRPCGFAIRDAVGQLHECRTRRGLSDTLNSQPTTSSCVMTTLLDRLDDRAILSPSPGVGAAAMSTREFEFRDKTSGKFGKMTRVASKARS